MTLPARLLICCAITTSLAGPAAAQSTMTGTPPPLVTAGAESWYLDGSPVTFAGRTYYPAGPRVHFLPSEMVRSGEFNRVPLYTRTTIEPNSVVFVPVGGGLMQPYERRRDGDLAGTTGSSAPSFPIALASDPAVTFQDAVRVDVSTGPQAAAPPVVASQTPAAVAISTPQPVGTTGSLSSPADTVRGAAATPAAVTHRGVLTPTAAVAARAAASPSVSSRTRRTAAATRLPQRTDAKNGIYIDYAGAQWFSSGAPVAWDAARFAKTGERNGLPVYEDRSAPGIIYVPVLSDSAGLVAPYARRAR